MNTQKLAFITFADAEGRPTCAVSADDDETCTFLGTRGFGSQPVCLFPLATNNWIYRRGEDGLGSLIPCKDCPFEQ